MYYILVYLFAISSLYIFFIYIDSIGGPAVWFDAEQVSIKQELLIKVFWSYVWFLYAIV